MRWWTEQTDRHIVHFLHLASSFARQLSTRKQEKNMFEACPICKGVWINYGLMGVYQGEMSKIEVEANSFME